MYMLLFFEYDYSSDSSGFNEADVVVLGLQHEWDGEKISKFRMNPGREMFVLLLLVEIRLHKYIKLVVVVEVITVVVVSSRKK